MAFSVSLGDFVLPWSRADLSWEQSKNSTVCPWGRGGVANVRGFSNKFHTGLVEESSVYAQIRHIPLDSLGLVG